MAASLTNAVRSAPLEEEAEEKQQGACHKIFGPPNAPPYNAFVTPPPKQAGARGRGRLGEGCLGLCSKGKWCKCYWGSK